MDKKYVTKATNVENDNIVPLRFREWTDTQIVEGIKSGNKAAADALVEKYAERIDQRIWRLLGADSEHADIVQNVFVCIIRAIPKVKSPEALPSWISRIVINEVRSELKQRKKRRGLGIIVREPVEEMSELTDDQGDQGNNLGRIFAIIGSMNPEEQIAFTMRFIEGATLHEIAEATGRSLATVKRRVIRARDIFAKKALRDRELAPLVEDLSGGDHVG